MSSSHLSGRVSQFETVRGAKPTVHPSQSCHSRDTVSLSGSCWTSQSRAAAACQLTTSPKSTPRRARDPLPLRNMSANVWRGPMTAETTAQQPWCTLEVLDCLRLVS